MVSGLNKEYVTLCVLFGYIRFNKEINFKS